VQFFAEGSDGILWRKIYCLEGDSVLVTCLLENRRATPLDESRRVWVDLREPTYFVARVDCFKPYARRATDTPRVRAAT